MVMAAPMSMSGRRPLLLTLAHAGVVATVTGVAGKAIGARLKSPAGPKPGSALLKYRGNSQRHLLRQYLPLLWPFIELQACCFIGL